jgi:hypothetical protein
VSKRKEKVGTFNIFRRAQKRSGIESKFSIALISSPSPKDAVKV